MRLRCKEDLHPSFRPSQVVVGFTTRASRGFVFLRQEKHGELKFAAAR